MNKSVKKDFKPNTEASSVFEDIALTDEEQRAVDALNIYHTFERGQLLVSEGEVIRVSFFVKTGCVRQYYLRDGEEKTTFFFTENQAVPSLNTQLSQHPSPYFLQCTERSELTIISMAQEAELYERFPRFQVICRVATEKQLANYQKMFALYRLSSPEERYRHLMVTRPDLLNRVPQYHLASYLGIQPESLSRIKKRLLTG